jgi:hypothetical protein
MIDRTRLFKSDDLQREKMASLGRLAAGRRRGPEDATVRRCSILYDEAAVAHHFNPSSSARFECVVECGKTPVVRAIVRFHPPDVEGTLAGNRALFSTRPCRRLSDGADGCDDGQTNPECENPPHVASL